MGEKDDRSTPGEAERTARAGTAWTFFVHDVRDRAKVNDDRAAQIATTVLCALDQRVIGNDDPETNGLPQSVRGMLKRCPRHPGPAPLTFGRKEVLAMVRDELAVEADEAERLTRSVFAALRETLNDEELEQVRREIPEDLHDLWHPTM